tara:strand:- start:12669 stop:13145 length:477 start_codon:yes stop_codon:yes gene_type:complete
MKDRKTNKQFTQGEKAKRGWWFSVFFMLLVVALIIFLSFVKIVDENRDVLVGLIGMITGAVSSMLAIASGRDPSEVEELKDKLSSANADRSALIARLRDAQIQMQLLREQIFELQNAVIDKLSMFQKENPIKTKTSDQVILHKEVEDWLPKVNRDDNL